MPPAASGFRYTPQGYLQGTSTGSGSARASPTASTSTGTGSSHVDDELAALTLLNEESTNYSTNSNYSYRTNSTTPKSRQRRPSYSTTTTSSTGSGYSSAPPSSTPSSSLDRKRFQSRVEERKDLYRGILQGDLEVNNHEDGSVHSDSLEYSVAVLDRHASSSTSTSTGALSHDANNNNNSSNNNNGNSLASETSRLVQQARQARQRRLASNSKVTSDSEAIKVRSMRAQRLRQAKRQSVEEEDFSEVLRLRRLAQMEEDRLERIRQEEEETKERLLQMQSLAEERDLLEAAKREAARDPDQHQRSGRRRGTPTSFASRDSSRKSRRRGEDSSATEYSLLQDFQILLRDSGLIRTCVTSCFGDDEDLQKDAKRMTKTSRRGKSASKKAKTKSLGDDLEPDLEATDSSDDSMDIPNPRPKGALIVV